MVDFVRFKIVAIDIEDNLEFLRIFGGLDDAVQGSMHKPYDSLWARSD